MATEEQNHILWENIKHISVAMMSTNDKGMIRARPMHLIQESYNGIFWFFAYKSSAKVDEVSEDEAVNLVFMDSEHDIYMSFSGLARICEDTQKKKELSKPGIETWFPDGIETDEVILIEVNVDFAEYWDSSANKMMQAIEMGLAKINNRTPKIGTNEKIV